ncbi:uncharacterized protein IL334_006357 [Kwoniella shivajii]|uniref:No apical meristem-associated C-terminal domain-containing protein n=1 Tax=Kwoniella shivajii TaxID=564305 RepID=A0ABZ1D6E2_9TREE|nr:hypothetical protein IL334_006357 [Kwoniella shivajii]
MSTSTTNDSATTTAAMRQKLTSDFSEAVWSDKPISKDLNVVLNSKANDDAYINDMKSAWSSINAKDEDGRDPTRKGRKVRYQSFLSTAMGEERNDNTRGTKSFYFSSKYANFKGMYTDQKGFQSIVKSTMALKDDGTEPTIDEMRSRWKNSANSIASLVETSAIFRSEVDKFTQGTDDDSTPRNSRKGQPPMRKNHKKKQDLWNQLVARAEKEKAAKSISEYTVSAPETTSVTAQTQGKTLEGMSQSDKQAIWKDVISRFSKNITENPSSFSDGESTSEIANDTVTQSTNGVANSVATTSMASTRA